MRFFKKILQENLDICR